MSKSHESQKNVKKTPQKSLKEKKAEKRAKKAGHSEDINIKKVFEKPYNKMESA